MISDETVSMLEQNKKEIRKKYLDPLEQNEQLQNRYYDEKSK